MNEDEQPDISDNAERLLLLYGEIDCIEEGGLDSVELSYTDLAQRLGLTVDEVIAAQEELVKAGYTTEPEEVDPEDAWKTGEPPAPETL